jgi:type VI secretion system secreted protein VgrG
LRFEHRNACHLLIFADDPACFPHRSTPVQFKPPALQAVRSPAISYLAEHWALQPITPNHTASSHRQVLKTPNVARINEQDASNQRFEASVLSRLPTERQAHDRQISARALERQRCERRTILGLSTDLPMTPGQIIQIQAHPEARFNDQWLLVEVTPIARQPHLLRDRAPADVAQIIEVIKSLAALSGPALKDFDAEPYSHGYSNSFRVLPWEMPFRPALKHRKPAAGRQTATLLREREQTKDQRLDGRLPIGFVPDSDEASAELYAHACLSLPQLKALRIGATLSVGHFESDPERPIILEAPDGPGEPYTNCSLDSLPGAEEVHLDLPQTLHLTAGRELLLATADARFELTATRISMTGTPPLWVAKDRSTAMNARKQHAALTFLDADLRLTELPGLSGAPLAHCLWYIVRMRAARLEFLARLQPEHFLFEGKTDKHGYCGLGPQQLRELAAAYRKSPEDLCLVHPGQCIKLQTWFEQNWPRRLHEAFRQHR